LKYLLILFVIALALAPLGHFLPSKRQRKIARMREYAALHGLFVEFRSLPALSDVPGSPGGVIYYGKRLPTSRAGPVAAGTWILAGYGWRSVGRRLPVPRQLADLSVEILAASVDEFSCGVYWTESAEEESVEQIKQILECWCVDLMQ
jgi:hypothetical protein